MHMVIVACGVFLVSGEICPYHDVENIQRRQQRRNNQRNDADIGHAVAAGHCRRCQCPFAVEARKGRHTDQPQAGDGHGGKGNGHQSAEAFHFIQIFSVSLIQNRTSSKEKRDLDDCVIHHMQQPCPQARRCHQSSTEDDIGQVGYSGISKSSLYMRRTQGHRGTKHDGDGRRNEHHVLGPSANQERSTEAVIDQSDDGEYAGFYDCHSVQQSRNGRRRNGSLGQPAPERKYRRFYAKAEECHHEYQPQGLFIPRYQVMVQHAAHDEVCGRAEAIDKYEADEGQGRTEHHINHIHFSGMACLIVKLVHNQGQRRQCQEFIEQIHCQEVRRKSDTNDNAECHGKEGEKSVFMAFMGHVFKGIDGGDDPKNRNHRTEYLGKAVHMEGQRKLIIELEQRHIRITCAKDGKQGKNRIQHHNGQHPDLSLLSGFKFHRQQGQPRNDRKDHR